MHELCDEIPCSSLRLEALATTRSQPSFAALYFASQQLDPPSCLLSPQAPVLLPFVLSDSIDPSIRLWKKE